MKDYYKILGVDKTVSEKDLKKSYRTLSKKYHPDKNPDDKEAEEKFKEISEAYGVLSNKDKRKNYDAGGSRFSNHQRQKRQRVGGDVRINLNLSLEELYGGIKKVLKYKRDVLCGSCNGTGGTTRECDLCKGVGVVIQVIRTPFGFIEQAHACQFCGGEGEIIEKSCETCNGTGVVVNEETVELDIQRGLDNSDTLVLGGHGNFIRNGLSGNLLVVINVDEHIYFERKLDNLIYTAKISYPKMLLGTEIELISINGKKIKLTIPKNSYPGKILRLRGKGMPSTKMPAYGDLYVEMEIEEFEVTESIEKILNNLEDELVLLKK